MLGLKLIHVSKRVYRAFVTNSLAPRIFEQNFRSMIFKLILVIDGSCVSCEIAVRWISLDFTDDKSTLVQVMAWCREATSHYLSQCWLRFMLPYDVNRQQGVNKDYRLVFGACAINHIDIKPRDIVIHPLINGDLVKSPLMKAWIMMTSWNENIFRVTGPLCREFPGHRSFDIFFDLRLNKQLNKQSRGWWFETLSLLWRHCNMNDYFRRSL